MRSYHFLAPMLAPYFMLAGELGCGGHVDTEDVPVVICCSVSDGPCVFGCTDRNIRYQSPITWADERGEHECDGGPGSGAGEACAVGTPCTGTNWGDPFKGVCQ